MRLLRFCRVCWRGSVACFAIGVFFVTLKLWILSSPWEEVRGDTTMSLDSRGVDDTHAHAHAHVLPEAAEGLRDDGRGRGLSKGPGYHHDQHQHQQQDLHHNIIIKPAAAAVASSAPPDSHDNSSTMRHLHSMFGRAPSSSSSSSSSHSLREKAKVTTTRRKETRNSFIKLEGVDSIGNDMFLAYAASLKQLKSICSALEDCEGFNSDGWVKTRINNKQRSSIDLYMKQTATVFVEPEEFPEGDVSAGVFWDKWEDYSEMEQSLKIYVYDTSIGQQYPSLEDYKYGVEYMFLSLLSKSKFRTKSPDEATFFFVPARCTAYRKSVKDLEKGKQKAALVTRELLENIKRDYPFWNASLGTDHFYICAHDMGANVTEMSDRELFKNAIGLVNTADYAEPMFVPHKDVSIPPHSGRGIVDWSVVGAGGAPFDPMLRTMLVFFAGHPGRGSVRPKVIQLFGSDPDFRIVQGYISDDDYMHALKTTKFCLCPRGNVAWSPRIMDAIWFGCVPVIISDYYVPPLNDLIDWDAISITVPEKQIPDLKRILFSVSQLELKELQENIQKVYHHLTWHDPPHPFDAFHSVLYELWQKRHIRRLRTLPVMGGAYRYSFSPFDSTV